MAKKKSTEGGETVNAPTPTTSKRGGPRGPRGIKLTIPAEIQKQISDLPEIYPKLKDAPARYLALLEPSLDTAYHAAFDQLLESLEAERAAKVAALRGITPLAHEASMAPDESYAALDDETAQ